MSYFQRNYPLRLPIILTVFLIGCNQKPSKDIIPSDFQTGIIAQDKSAATPEDWGQFYNYYEGQTHYIKDTLTGVAIINPGKQIHPPHKHAEEEFLMILEGEGTWTIGTTDSLAKAGDIMYSAPWDLHGIRNTGPIPLKFVVFKYNPKTTITKPKLK